MYPAVVLYRVLQSVQNLMFMSNGDVVSAPACLSMRANVFELFVSGRCKVDYQGRKFVLMYIENADSSENLMLFISSTGGRPATVNIDAPAHSSKFHKTVNIPSGQTRTVDIPKELQASGVSVEGKGIYVRASEDVVVLGFSKHSGSCGSFKVMPEDALGYN